MRSVQSATAVLQCAIPMLPMPLLLLGSAAAATASASPSKSPPRGPGSAPHIITLLVGDLGRNNVPWNPNSVVQALHAKALFDEALSVPQDYVHRWCTPTRAALMVRRSVPDCRPWAPTATCNVRVQIVRMDFVGLLFSPDGPLRLPQWVEPIRFRAVLREVRR